MTDLEPQAELVEELDGVTLTKAVDDGSFQFPSIVYDFTSDRDDAVTIRIVDSVPEDLSMDNIGMHPSHGDEYWSIDDNQLVFEYTLEPHTDFRTIYAVRPESRYGATELFGPPKTVDIIPSVTAPSSPTTTGSFTRSAAGDSDSPGETGSETGTDGDITLEPVGDGDDDEPAPAIEPRTADGESLVDVLAGELQAGTASRESLEVLDARFGGTEQSRGSLAARVDQIQTDVSSLRAYSGALEEFLDENGSAREILAAHDSQLESLEVSLTAHQASTDALVDDQDSVHDEVRDVTTTVHALEDEVRDVTATVESVAMDVDDLDDRVPAYNVEERIDELEADIAELATFLNALKSAFE